MNDLIINADDFGRSQSINKAIDYAFQSGIINRTTLMVSLPFVEEARAMAQSHGYLDSIGLHLNLDLGTPMTEDIKRFGEFCNPDGTFNGAFRSERLGLGIRTNKALMEAVNEEVVAQMERYISLGLPAMHIDSHHHVHTKPFLQKMVLELARSYGFKTMRIARNMGGINVVKLYIKEFNNKAIRKRFSTTRFFGSYDDWRYSQPSGTSVEIMVHPDYIDGQYVDVLNYDKQLYRGLQEIKIL